MPFRDKQWARDLLGAVMGVCAVVVAAAVVYFIVAIRSAQIGNTDLLEEMRAQGEQIKALAAQIDSCTDSTADDGDPAGQCYKDGQAAQAGVIGKPAGPINTVMVSALACQLHVEPGTVQEQASEIAQCVSRELTRQAEEAAQ